VHFANLVAAVGARRKDTVWNLLRLLIPQAEYVPQRDHASG
jgi:hypothetical protein